MYFFFFFDRRITNRINKTKRIAADMELFADNRIIFPLIIFCSQYTLFLHEVHNRTYFFWSHILPRTFLCAPDLVHSYATKISFFCCIYLFITNILSALDILLSAGTGQQYTYLSLLLIPRVNIFFSLNFFRIIVLNKRSSIINWGKHVGNKKERKKI